MHKPFLRSVAETIYDTHQEHLGEILLVVPGNRAGRILLNYLKESIQGSVSWLPEMKGISELVSSLSDLKLLDRLELLIELFQVHRKFNEEETFSSFLKWGNTALSDYNEIENYLINSERLYADLKDIKDIEDWSFNEEVLSANQQKFQDFWDYLGRLKKAFDNQLSGQGLGYAGLLMKNALEKLELPDFSVPYKHIYFIGLNAISNAERELIHRLNEKVNLTVLSDSDTYYQSNPVHEAGHFMRKQEEFFQLKHELTDGFSQPKNINYIRANTVLGMAQVAASLCKGNIEKTALILGDEKLLTPLLTHLPPEINEANITMGYPLVEGSVWFGITDVLDLCLAVQRDESTTLESVYAIVENAYLKTALSDLSEVNSRLEEHTAAGKFRLTKDEIIGVFSITEWIGDLLKSETSSELLTHVLGVVHESFESENNGYGFIKEQIAYAYQLVQKMIKKVSSIPELEDFQSFYPFIQTIAKNEKVPFLGEPYGGLQIMGLLEARALDFDRVIFCGATDALLPAVSSDSSFIPFELKVLNGLPTNREKEAVFGYSFYRLLQRAENIDLIYVETEEGLVANEKSRFLTQLENELPSYSGTEINYHRVAESTESELVKVPSVVKTEGHVEEIEKLLHRGISASAINTFLSCPADFYYKYVVGIREPEKTGAVIHPSVSGSILHDTLESLYTPLVKKVLTEDNLKAIGERAMKELDHQIELKNLTQFMNQGENKLELLVMREKLKNYLNWEKSEIKRLKKTGQVITIYALEKKYKVQVPGLQTPSGVPVTLAGFIDRIDRVGDTFRIVDYKSGKVESTQVTLPSSGEFTDGKKSKALQLMTYALMSAEEIPELKSNAFIAGNISLHNISLGLQTLKESRKPTLQITEKELEQFKEMLNQVIAQIVNMEQPFEHNLKAEYCDFCLV